MRGDPLLGLLRNGKQGFKVVKIEGCAIAPGGGLILEPFCQIFALMLPYRSV
jgi:hypothetical protein